MSKGTRLIPIRIPPAVLAAVDAEVERSKLSPKGQVSRAEWIMSAILEKLRHQERSNRGKTPSGRMTVEQLRTVEEHRRRAYEGGVTWDCDCPVCTGARSED